MAINKCFGYCYYDEVEKALGRGAKVNAMILNHTGKFDHIEGIVLQWAHWYSPSYMTPDTTCGYGF